jgi:predicted HTH transcriptional regulator
VEQLETFNPLSAWEFFKGGEKMEEKEKKVLDAMKEAGKPVRPGDLAKMMGEESKEISKVINALKKKGKVISPKRCYYAPNDE